MTFAKRKGEGERGGPLSHVFVPVSPCSSQPLDGVESTWMLLFITCSFAFGPNDGSQSEGTRLTLGIPESHALAITDFDMVVEVVHFNKHFLQTNGYALNRKKGNKIIIYSE